MECNTIEKVRTNVDTPWKLVIDHFFKQLIEFLLPDMYQLIDWNKTYKCLDSELLALEKDTGNLLADKLIEVYRKDGVKEYILIHVEVQGRSQKHFSQRMFEYFCRLYSMHKKPIFCIAILTSKSRWNPQPFTYTFGKRTFTWEYDVIKLWEQKNNPILKLSNNPFARIIELQLAANDKSKSYKSRFESKLNLLKYVVSLDYPRDHIRIFLSFIDYLFQLPKNMDNNCNKQFRIHLKESKMPYVSSFEKMIKDEGVVEGVKQGIQEGVQQGVQQGKLSVLFTQLERKFGNLNERIIGYINNASPNELDAIVCNVLTAENIEELISEKAK